MPKFEPFEGGPIEWKRYKAWILESDSKLHIAHLAFCYRQKQSWLMSILPDIERDPDWEKVFPLLLAWSLANSD